MCVSNKTCLNDVMETAGDWHKHHLVLVEVSWRCLAAQQQQQQKAVTKTSKAYWLFVDVVKKSLNPISFQPDQQINQLSVTEFF